jgi:hypothetical protein
MARETSKVTESNGSNFIVILSVVDRFIAVKMPVILHEAAPIAH